MSTSAMTSAPTGAAVRASDGGGGDVSRRDDEEERILQELVEVVEQRDALVALLDEDRQRYTNTFPLNDLALATESL